MLLLQDVHATHNHVPGAQCVAKLIRAALLHGGMLFWLNPLLLTEISLRLSILGWEGALLSQLHQSLFYMDSCVSAKIGLLSRPLLSNQP
jgi:hypothetical protein